MLWRSHAVNYTQYTQQGILPSSTFSDSRFPTNGLQQRPRLTKTNYMVKRLTSTLRTNKLLNKFLHLRTFHRLNSSQREVAKQDNSYLIYLLIRKIFPFWRCRQIETPKLSDATFKGGRSALACNRSTALIFVDAMRFPPQIAKYQLLCQIQNKTPGKVNFLGGSPILRKQLFLTLQAASMHETHKTSIHPYILVTMCHWLWIRLHYAILYYKLQVRRVVSSNAIKSM